MFVLCHICVPHLYPRFIAGKDKQKTLEGAWTAWNWNKERSGK